MISSCWKLVPYTEAHVLSLLAAPPEYVLNAKFCTNLFFWGGGGEGVVADRIENTKKQTLVFRLVSLFLTPMYKFNIQN